MVRRGPWNGEDIKMMWTMNGMSNGMVLGNGMAR